MTQQSIPVPIPEAGQKQRLGQCGEYIAANYFLAKGFRILAQNWRCRTGELDLVLYGEQALVIAEVKTRTGVDFGHPFEGITQDKHKRLHRLASYWLKKHRHQFPVLHSIDTYRLDGIGIILTTEGLTLVHYRGLDD